MEVLDISGLTKLPRGQHAAHGLWVGKPWVKVSLLFQMLKGVKKKCRFLTSLYCFETRNDTISCLILNKDSKNKEMFEKSVLMQVL